MITLDEDVLTPASQPAGQVADASLETGAISSLETGAISRHPLLAGTGAPRHCRRPMKRLDQEFSLEMAIRVDGQRLIRSMKTVGAADAVTYRCMCGFTIDVPAPGMKQALIN